MKITVQPQESLVCLALEGDIDERGAEELKAAFRQLSLEGVREVALDFDGVTHIGSAGIGKLLVFYKDLAVRSKTLRLDRASPLIHQLLCEMKLDSLFTINARSTP